MSHRFRLSIDLRTTVDELSSSRQSSDDACRVTGSSYEIGVQKVLTLRSAEFPRSSDVLLANTVRCGFRPWNLAVAVAAGLGCVRLGVVTVERHEFGAGALFDDLAGIDYELPRLP